MKGERLKRYKDKIMLIEKRISQISNWITGFSVEDFIRDEKTKLAVYKAFQEAVEALTDIIAMMCKDLGIPPKDDYMNIESLKEQGLLSEKTASALVESNGLRNRLVHHYNKLSDEVAFERIQELSEEILRFIEVVEEWLRHLTG